MKNNGVFRIAVILGLLYLSLSSLLGYSPQSLSRPTIVLTIISMSIILIRQQNEQQQLSSLIKKQTESYREILRHHIKTPVLAEIRALELLLKGVFGNLNNEQKEMLELTLTSCKQSYKIIRAQLYP